MGVHQPSDFIAERERIRREGEPLRSRFLDGFARLESSVHAYGQRLQLKTTATAPFGQHLKALRAAREQFRHPKKLDERLDEISELNAIRADIVHAVLESAQVWDGKEQVSLLQFRNVGAESALARQFSCEALAKLATRVTVLAHQFSQQQLKAPAPTGRASASE